MRRRNFISAVIGGLVAIPLVSRGGTAQPKSVEIKPDDGTWYLTHKESRSGLRCTDVRIRIDRDNPAIADYLRKTAHR